MSNQKALDEGVNKSGVSMIFGKPVVVAKDQLPAPIFRERAVSSTNIEGLKMLFPGEINYCTIDDVRNAPSANQMRDDDVGTKEHSSSLTIANAFAKLISDAVKREAK